MLPFSLSLFGFVKCTFHCRSELTYSENMDTLDFAKESLQELENKIR